MRVYLCFTTPANWWRREDSNLCRPEGQRVYSASHLPLMLRLRTGARGGTRTHTHQALDLTDMPISPTRAVVPQAGFEPARSLILSQVRLPSCATGAKIILAEGERLELPAVSPVTVFRTARPAYSPTLRRHLLRDRREGLDFGLRGESHLGITQINNSAPAIGASEVSVDEMSVESLSCYRPDRPHAGCGSDAGLRRQRARSARDLKATA